jgi:hypothetical protein
VVLKSLLKNALTQVYEEHDTVSAHPRCLPVRALADRT